MRTCLGHAKPVPSFIQTRTNGGASHARPDATTSSATGFAIMVAFICASPRAVTEVIVQKGVPQKSLPVSRSAVITVRISERERERERKREEFSV